MLFKFWYGIKKLFKILKKSLFPAPLSSPSIGDVETSLEIINDKIKLLTGTSKKSVSLLAYEKYFNFLEKLGLKEDFDIISTEDNLILCGSSIKPILINKNNQKVVIFAHGVTNNRWSLFYTMHLALQRGYHVVTYDARNHGISSKSFTSLGQVESCDLQDIIVWIRKKYRPEKIGLYGFSMGASTCLFWLSFFGGPANSEVVFAICEAPFDYFAKQRENLLGWGINRYWKKYLLNKIIHEVLNSSQEKLEKVNPFLTLPQKLPIKLLLLHGLKDSFLDWRASFNLYFQLNKSKLNNDRVNFYLCRYADHGDLPFMADYIPNSLRWKTRKRRSRFNFTTLFCNYLQKNL